MSSDYGWDISKQATERILTLSPRRRKGLIEHLDLLASGLETSAEAHFMDTEGATHHVSTMGKLVVTFVIDHPVKLVHIVAIK